MHLAEQLFEAMVAHARFARPEEACGLLAADPAGSLRMAYCLSNVDASPTRYTVDPTEHLRALQHAERHGWDIAGVYHSHPNGAAYPSSRDVAQALDPEWLYVIVGLAGAPDVRAYRIRGGVVTEERLEVAGR